MHGRKKSNQLPSETEVEGIRRKKATYNGLVDILFGRMRSLDYSTETLAITSKMLTSSPDFSTIWNFRRDILISLHGIELGLSSSVPDVAIHNHRLVKDDIPNQAYSTAAIVRDQELQLTVDCIRKNSKSYCAWHHRQWIIERFEVDFENELKLCEELLRLDQRNFHCWNYRRALVSIAGLPAMREFLFAEEKILENFSNYSAFHHRSHYITKINTPITEILDKELNIIENAIFTEPDDQSAWWYQHFLMCLAGKDVSKDNQDYLLWLIGVVKKQVVLIEGLLEMEMNSKWAMTAIVEMSRLLETVYPLLDATGVLQVDLESVVARKDELIARLKIIDPAHINRYNYLISH